MLGVVNRWNRLEKFESEEASKQFQLMLLFQAAFSAVEHLGQQNKLWTQHMYYLFVVVNAFSLSEAENSLDIYLCFGLHQLPRKILVKCC